MPLHDGQRKFLTDATAKINVLVPANRWGKSVTAAIKHIHHCFYKTGIGRGNSVAWERARYSTANIAPHSDLTGPVFQAVKQILTSSFHIPQEDGSIKNNECAIEWFMDSEHIRNSVPYYIPFTNNSDILFRSTGEDKGDSLQGKSFGYISYDEGGRSDWLDYEMSSNILPRLSDLNGTLDIISTPDQKSPSILYHYDLFERGKLGLPGYYSQEGSITENIFLLRANPDHVKMMEEIYRGDPILEQVLYGKFVFAGDSIFPGEDIQEAKDPVLDHGERYKDNHQYVVGIDTAMGEDEMVYTVLDVTAKPFRVVRQMACKGNSKSPQMHMNDLLDLYDSYCPDHPYRGTPIANVKVILETWNGESARFYQDLPPEVARRTTCFGSWQPIGVKVIGRNPKSVRKAEIIIALRKLLAQKTIKLPNEPHLIKQLAIYREDDERIPTDRVMSLALACWLATDGRPKQTVVKPQYVEW